MKTPSRPGRVRRLLPILLPLVFLSLSPAVRADAKRVDFARQILPLLSEKCFVCHGPDTREKDLVRLDSEAGATRDLGGYRAIDRRNPDKSEILARIHDADSPMPPSDSGKKLTDDERTLLRRWIEQGGDYATHWAFVPPVKQAPPGGDAARGREIDAFIGARLADAGVDFAPEADRATLARRLALTLTGLPPKPDQLAAFLADERPDADARFVETLLASPSYGEHQARYWLDAVRYGDTHGLHLDNRRGIYPYRDWVVHAFNRNLPFDKFITWQLAGDLLPRPTLEQRVATGFVRMNPTTSEGGAIPEEFQAKNNFDRTENLGTVLLGMSLICARCHTHKYDPIPQTEYYRLFAFFNSTAEKSMDGNSYTYEPVLKAPSNQAQWARWKLLEDARTELFASVKSAFNAGRTPGDRAANTWRDASRDERLALLADPSSPFASLDLADEASRLTQAMSELAEGFTTTLVAADLESPRETFVLSRGEYNLPTGEPLQPDVLSVMGSFPDGAPRNRLGLARWLTSPGHPLVARVLVNRIWQRVFGAGLVRTPEDFGLQGQQPTHPELLDWLAIEFQESGWDLRHMLRLMVHSRTFRQSSAWREDLDDPENQLFARGPRYRLDAEVIRDLALWASDLLDPEMGGEGVKPYQPGGLWKALAHPSSNTKEYKRDTGEKIYRRSLYVYWKRTSPHPMMTLFDAPSREASCVRRSRTNTSLQSLGLFNETQRVEVSRALAQRLLTEAADVDARLNLLFAFLASREPSDRERTVCMSLYERSRARYQAANGDALALLSVGEAPRDETLDAAEHAAWTQVAITVLSSDVALLLY